MIDSRAVRCLFAHGCKTRRNVKTLLLGNNFPPAFKPHTSFYSMLQQHHQSKAFVSTLILLRVQFKKQLATMSVSSLSEGSSKRPAGINEDGSEAADLKDTVTSSIDQAGGEFTEEETAIHRAHRQACEVGYITAESTSGHHGVVTDHHHHHHHLQPAVCCLGSCTVTVLSQWWKKH